MEKITPETLLAHFEGKRIVNFGNPNGRPTVMTDEVLEKLKQGFMIGLNDVQACEYAKISKATLYNYQTRYPEFLEQKEDWKEHPIFKAKVTVYNKLDEVEHAKWYLERKAKDEFGTRNEITGAGGADLIPRLIAKLEETDYTGVAEEARKQMVAIDAPLQNQGQAGAASNIPPELPPVETPSGTG